MTDIKNNKYFKIVVIIFILIIIAIILTIKPWISKPKSVKATQIGDMNVYSPVLSTNNKDILYYDLTKLNLYKYNLETKVASQLSKNMTDIPDSLIWSPDRSRVLMRIYYDKTKFEAENSIFTNSTIPDGENTTWVYDISTQNITLLKNKIAQSSLLPSAINPIWTADSKNIIYYYSNQTGSEYNLGIADPNGQNEQILGSVPGDIFSILSYDSKNKFVYYSTQTNDETGVAQIFKFNLTTSQKDLLFDGKTSSATLEDHQFLYNTEDQSILYNTTDNSKKVLPVTVFPEQSVLNTDKTKLLTDVIADNVEEFYIIDLAKLKVIKKLDPGTKDTGYMNLSWAENDNIFFVNTQKLFEINY